MSLISDASSLFAQPPSSDRHWDRSTKMNGAYV